MSNNSVVVVTGVSSGIGRVAAEKFAQQGCQVCLARCVTWLKHSQSLA